MRRGEKEQRREGERQIEEDGREKLRIEKQKRESERLAGEKREISEW